MTLNDRRTSGGRRLTAACLLLLVGFVSVTSQAQERGIEARVMFENAETAFEKGNTNEALGNLSKVDQLLGEVNPRTQFFRVQIWKKAYETDTGNLEGALREVKRYLALDKEFTMDPDQVLEVTRFKIDLEREKAARDEQKRREEEKKRVLEAAKDEFNTAKKEHNAGNYSESLRLLQKSAENGYAPAMTWVGWYHDEGYGVSVNRKNAYQWYMKGYNGGDVHAATRMGIGYHEGRFGDRDLNKAVQWLEYGVQGGDRSGEPLLAQLKGEQDRLTRLEVQRQAELAAYRETYSGGALMYDGGAIAQIGLFWGSFEVDDIGYFFSVRSSFTEKDDIAGSGGASWNGEMRSGKTEFTLGITHPVIVPFFVFAGLGYAEQNEYAVYNNGSEELLGLVEEKGGVATSFGAFIPLTSWLVIKTGVSMINMGNAEFTYGIGFNIGL